MTEVAVIAKECQARNIREIRVFHSGLEDPRMQNVAVLAELCRQKLVPGVEAAHVEAALNDLLAGPTLVKNLELFRRVING